MNQNSSTLQYFSINAMLVLRYLQGRSVCNIVVYRVIVSSCLAPHRD